MKGLTEGQSVEEYIACNKKRKGDWGGHILHRNFLLKHLLEGIIEERIDVTGGGGRKCKQELYNLKETRGYWKLKGNTRDGSLWRGRFGTDCGSVVRLQDEV
jgi:hypothetical protein